MRNILKSLFLSLFVTAALSFLLPSAGFAAKGETYYTRMNMWYEKPEKIMSTNYHKGTILPVGTQVEIIKEGKKIKFRDKATGTEYRLILHSDYTNLTNEEFFNRYFSKENILNSSEYSGFSGSEKDNIKRGTLEKGMSKKAVLVSYGYPPSHRTPSTAGSDWVFWKSRMVNFGVHFDGDTLAETPSNQ